MNTNSELVSLVKNATFDIIGFNILLAVCLHYSLTEGYIQCNLFGKQYCFSARYMNRLYFPLTCCFWGLLHKRYQM